MLLAELLADRHGLPNECVRGRGRPNVLSSPALHPLWQIDTLFTAMTTDDPVSVLVIPRTRKGVVKKTGLGLEILFEYEGQSHRHLLSSGGEIETLKKNADPAEHGLATMEEVISRVRDGEDSEICLYDQQAEEWARE